MYPVCLLLHSVRISSSLIAPKYNNSSKKMFYRPKKCFCVIGIELGLGVT